jgi:hypothetical protein
LKHGYASHCRAPGKGHRYQQIGIELRAAGPVARGTKRRQVMTVAPVKATDYKQYAYSSLYDRAKIRAGYAQHFGKLAAVANVADNIGVLLTMIEADPTITDVRWVAYMLATIMLETKSNIDGVWLITMAPVSEYKLGSGKRYFHPVKVEVQTGDKITVIERDGDKFSVSASGYYKPISKNADYGSKYTGPEGKEYAASKGLVRTFYGRGYVQLTWWYNYVTAGKVLGKGSDFLLDPELVLNSQIAYNIMTIGMVKGKIFTRTCFTDYFNSSKTDYAGARAMVNANDPQPDIVSHAKIFEAILLDAKAAKP